MSFASFSTASFLRKAVFFILVITIQTKLFAQLSANFSASPVSGCSPIVVQFSDKSTGGPTQWIWDLGNGTTSVLQNPSATYFNPGTYSVKLIVRNGSGSDSIVKNQLITVYANPNVNLKASDSSGCFPLGVQFTDVSSAGSGAINNWSWDFGDGSSSNSSNPYHTYTSAGNFTVTLKVTNSFGCTKAFSKLRYINVSNGVKAGFTHTTVGKCSAPVTVNFSNTTTGPGTITYNWDFGDGTSNTVANPSHTYTNAGTYTVSLIAVSPQGCSDTLKKINLISIGTLSSKFNSPDVACQGQSYLITNSSSPTPGSVVWNFGDGTTSTDINPYKTYNAPGTYIIKLVNNFGGCLDSTTKTISVIAKPVSEFTSGNRNFCSIPAIVKFSNSSSGAVSYEWNFGDGSTSTEMNPFHTYTAEGKYTVQLVSTNATGCTDTITKQDFIQIQKPVITINGFPQKGCVPLTIKPTASIVSNNSIVSYLWKFGDGATSNLINPTHTYTVAGNYDVSLIITTASGCTDSLTLANAVRVGDKPAANFSVMPNDVCAIEPVHFTDKSTGKVDDWFWEFGDGYTSTESNPTHSYSDTGWFNVTLIVKSNFCPDTLKLKDIVHIKPPIGYFEIARSCANKYKIDFVDKSIGATSWGWDFGDGTTSVQRHNSHTYSAPGTYIVKLFVSNGTCNYTYARAIQVVDEKADLVLSKTIVCKNNSVDYEPKNIDPKNIVYWQWDFGDGTSSTLSNPTHNYVTAGDYKVSLTITDIFGCSSSKSADIKVYGPSAEFSYDVPAACLENNKITFTDQSLSDGKNGLAKWLWNFGDGILDSAKAITRVHNYATSGNYTVSLTVIDNYGCSDQLVKSSAIIISKPHADFTAQDTVSCVSAQIQFINSSVGNTLQYDWNFGDAGQSNSIAPSHAYSAIGKYSVRLQVTDAYGCKDSLTKQSYIDISLPKALFTVSDSIGMCPPLNVVFTNQSSNYTNFQWDFGDGNTSILEKPSHYYTIPGIYYAKLTVTGPGGCTEVMTKKIEVRGPSGKFDYTPKVGCNPLTVNFKATTSDNVSFLWDYSDGNTKSSLNSISSHTYTTPGNYVPKLILTDASGCTVPIVGIDTIKVLAAVAKFTMNQTALCDVGTIAFKNTSTSNDPIKNYQWNFGDGSFATSIDVSHSYSTPGNYSIQLTVTTQFGCISTLTLTDTVKVYQSPIIQVTGDEEACVPAKVNFDAQIKKGDLANLTWKWNFGNGQTAAIQHPSAITYNTDGLYPVSVVATDSHGCSDSVVRSINIHPLPNTNAGADVMICKGSSVKLQATGADGYTWTASPDLSCIECSDPIAKPMDTIRFVVTGINQFGCARKDTIQVNVRQPFTLSVNPGDTICAGETVHLRASGTDLYQWSPSIGVDNTMAAFTTAKPLTTTTYQVIAKDKDNCFTDTASVYVKVWPVPTVNVTPDQTIIVGTSVRMKATASADVVSYNWTPAYNLSCYNCAEPDAKPKQDTKYTVEVKNDGGCKNRAALTVYVTCNNGNVFVPNTFSPNGDGTNDIFYPRGVGIDRIKSLKVFNRWGEIVFERLNFKANDPSAGWNGTYKGQVLTGDVYIYMCEVVCDNNEVLTYRGDLTLLK